MILLPVVLAATLIGALASNYDQHQRQRKKSTQLRNLNDVTKTDALADWIVRPPDIYSTFTDSSRLEGLLRRGTTEKTKTTIPIIATTQSPGSFESFSQDLKRAVEKLMTSVDNLNAAIQDIKYHKYSNPTRQQSTINRSKRDVSNVKNVTVVTNGTKDTINASAPNGGRESNDDIASAPAFQSGRRSGHHFESVKEKLLMYLDEGFHEIGTKVNSLTKIKHQFANVAAYKIGYIVANVDTLAVSIKNLREESRRNRELWAEKDILDVYDRLKISNSLITNLMETLRLLIEDG